MLRIFFSFVFLFLFSTASYAQSISITIGQGAYSGIGAGTELGDCDIFESTDIRISALSTLVGLYRNNNGLQSLPNGTLVRVTYRDGTSETFIVTGQNTSTVRAKPVAGTQRDKDGNLVQACDALCAVPTSPGSGEGGGTPGFWGSIWQFLIGYFNQPDPTGTVTVGDIMNP